MTNLDPRSTGLRRRIVLLTLALSLLVPISLSALQRKKTTPARQASQTPASSPSPTPEPSPPTVEFQAIPDRDSAGPDDEIRISLFLTNKSSKPLTKLKLKFADPSFTLTDVNLADPLPPFGSLAQTAIMTRVPKGSFGSHKLLFSLDYAWSANGAEFVSSQTTTATISIVRRFEEEAKGFPGGTAAFLYLLLPIIPAIISYQVFEEKRKGEPLKLPSFGAEYVVPAFLVAVVINLAVQVLFRFDTSLGYSDPLLLIGMLFVSFALGAAPPLYRWRRDFKLRESLSGSRTHWTGFHGRDCC
jgi:hypothetical protein